MNDDIEDDGPAPFALTPADRQSATWARLKTHLQDRLALLRTQNDGDLDKIQTASLRGQIKSIKGLLALETEMPPID